MQNMNGADWIVDYLIKKDVTDVFGIPGVVVLDFLYALDRRKDEIMPHLSYHEQGAAFAACGYAQSTGRLGVAYATRGPGIMNMMTGIADAYYDSIPTLFVTAHGCTRLDPEMRVLNNQEIDTVSLMADITKYAARIDLPEDLPREIERACYLACTGRKGPVFLDISSDVLAKPVVAAKAPLMEQDDNEDAGVVAQAALIAEAIRGSKRPVILLGNGVKDTVPKEDLLQFVSDARIPVLSSRSAQDVIPESELYYGYVGSHALRSSAFIIAKADLILSLGNRLSFPVDSASFRPIVENARILRVELDPAEFNRALPNTTNIQADVARIIPALGKHGFSYEGSEEWIGVCDELRKSLWQWDKAPTTEAVMELLEAADPDSAFVCDVGNHSFWVTTAYAYLSKTNRILYSASFGSLGSALPKAIGASLARRAPVVCFTGDQGLQMNIQELNMISQNRLPITVVVLNNRASGMIRDREKARFNGHFVHTTEDSGYRAPDLEGIAKVYGFEYCLFDSCHTRLSESAFREPCIIDFRMDKETPLYPMLPRGNECYRMIPELPTELFQRLKAL